MIDVATATFDELLAAEVCECGVAFSVHPPMPRKAPPLRSWQSQRASSMPWRNTITGRPRVWTEAQILYRQRQSGSARGPYAKHKPRRKA